MESRGMKQYAVMATKEGWSKPRFVWHLNGHLQIFSKKKVAVALAKRHNDAGVMFCPDGDRSKTIVVEWKAIPVWTETML